MFLKTPNFYCLFILNVTYYNIQYKKKQRESCKMITSEFTTLFSIVVLQELN